MKILVVFILLITPVLNIFSQEYIPFPTENCSWFSIYESVVCGPVEVCWKKQHVLKGDTLLYNALSKTLYTIVYEYMEWPTNQYDASEGFLCGIRNIPEEKKVMVNYGYEEKVLYDFDLKVGDTTKVNTDIAIVGSIDSVRVGSGYRKRFNLRSIRELSWTNFLDYSIVEGIGSTNGLFEFPNVYSWEYSRKYLGCVQLNNDIIFPNYYPDHTCYTPVSTNEITYQKNFIFPNPVSNELQIENHTEYNQYRIFDLNGKLVIQGKVSETIDIRNIRNGMYIIKLIDNYGHVSIDKIVILK